MTACNDAPTGLTLAGAYELAVEIHARQGLTLLAIGHFVEPSQITAATPWRVSLVTADGRRMVIDSADQLPDSPRAKRPEKSKPRSAAAKKTTQKQSEPKPAATLLDFMEG